MRVSFTREGSAAVIVEKNDYYAFGLKHGGPTLDTTGTNYRYQYNGKEMQDEIGMYDYGARFYMPDLGRWGVVDPLAEMNTRFSPYHYAANNPMRFIDPDGRNAMDTMMQLGGTWQNVGYGYFNAELGKYIDYEGNVMNAAQVLESRAFINGGGGAGSGGAVDVVLQEVIMQGKGKKWSTSSNFDYNSFILSNSILRALRDWNFDVNRTNMGQYIMNSKASMEVAAVERFLFIDIPLSFAGGELVAAGWRASGIGKILANQASKVFRIASSAGGETLPMTVQKIIPQGTKIADIVNDIKGLTWSTGNEHAVVRLANGQKAIVSGGPGGISFELGQIKTLFGHTHPTVAPPSAADFTALKILNQTRQYVLHGGHTTLIRP